MLRPLGRNDIHGVPETMLNSRYPEGRILFSVNEEPAATFGVLAAVKSCAAAANLISAKGYETL